MRLVFFGSGAFAAMALPSVAAAHEIKQVITSPPRPAGRKMREMPPPAAAQAVALGLPARHSITATELREMGAEAVVVCDYGRLLPPELLAAARRALNIHPSLLPRWRGAAPIERAVLAGDRCTGVSIMQLNERLDGGAVLAQRRVSLAPDMSAQALYPLLAAEGAALLLDVLADEARYPPQPQDESAATYAPKITAAECRLNFAEPAGVCLRQALALSPKPGAYFLLRGERARVLEAAAAEQRQGAAAGVLIGADGAITIACGTGSLVITRLQRAGKKAMTSADFLRGCPLDDLLGQKIA